MDNNEVKVSVTLGDETYSISRKTESADDAKSVTWTELMKTFLNVLNGIGYILPDDFENIIDENEDNTNKFINS